MPVEVKFPVVRGTQLDLTPNTSRLVTRAMISGLPTSVADDPEVIWQAYSAVTGLGAAYNFNTNVGLTGHSALTLQRLILRGITGNACVADIIHETPSFGGSPVSALLIRNRSFMTSRQANTYVDAAGKRQPIWVRGCVDPSTGDTCKDDYATIAHLHPTRAIQVSGLTYGTPANGGETLFGHVNQGTWQGLPRGYWLVTEWSTDISKYAGYYTYSITALTRETIDWGEIATLRNEKTGKFIKLPSTVEDNVGSAPYNNNLFLDEGATKVGPFPVANLTGIFGI
jgi:hypothetical protein